MMNTKYYLMNKYFKRCVKYSLVSIIFFVVLLFAVLQFDFSIDLPVTWIEQKLSNTLNHPVVLSNISLVNSKRHLRLESKSMNIHGLDSSRPAIASLSHLTVYLDFKHLFTIRGIASKFEVDSIQITAQSHSDKIVNYLLQQALQLEQLRVKRVAFQVNDQSKWVHIKNILMFNKEAKHSRLEFYLNEFKLQQTLSSKILIDINQLEQNVFSGHVYTKISPQLYLTLHRLLPQLTVYSATSDLSGSLKLDWIFNSHDGLTVTNGQCNACQISLDGKSSYYARALQFSQSKHSIWSFTFNHARYQASKKKDWFTIHSVNGQLSFNKKLYRLVINGSQWALNKSSLFIKPAYIERVKADLSINYQNAGNWFIDINSFLLKQGKHELMSSAKLIYKTTESKPLSLTIKSSHGKLAALKDYLWIKSIPESLRQWLFNAVKVGDFSDAIIHIRTKPSTFKPKDDITAQFKVHHVTLDFAPNWPVLRQANALFSFDKTGFSSKVIQGQLLDTNINSGQVVIPDYNIKYLTVSGKINTGLDVIKKDIKQLPFYSDKMQQVVSNLHHAEGKVSMTFKTIINLKNQGVPQYAVKLKVKDAHFISVKEALAYKAVVGEVLFTEQHALAKLHGRLFNQPFDFTIQGKTIKDDYHLNIKGVGLVEPKKLNTSIFPSSTLTYLDGHSTFKLDMDMILKPHAKLTNITLLSDLHGLKSSLPKPLNKLPWETTPIKIGITYSNNQLVAFKVDLKNKILADMYLDVKKSKLWQGLLKLGSHVNGVTAIVPTTSTGIKVYGHLSALDLLSWSHVATNLSSNQSIIKPFYFDSVLIDSMHLGNITLHNVKVKHLPNQQVLNINSREYKGLLDYSHIKEHKLKADLSWCQLNSNSINQAHLEQFFNRFSIDLSCQNTIYEKQSFGFFAFNSSRMNRKSVQFFIQQKDKEFTSSASGVLDFKSRKVKWSINGSIYYLNLSRMLHLFKISPGISSDNGSLFFNLSSYGLTQESVADLSGKLSLNLKHGSLTQVDAGASPLINLLSINKLAQRLTLDFSDVFAKGYYFDRLTGDLFFNNGVATTNNLILNGDSAFIRLEGKSILKGKKLKLNLGIMPHYTTPIPLTVAIFTVNPVAAIGAWAIDYLYKKQRTEPKIYNYLVQGTWSDPLIKQIKS